jgi:hypothetical protein
MRTCRERLWASWVVALCLSACGGGQRDAAPSTQSPTWSAAQVKTQPFSAGISASAPTQFVATRLPYWTGEGVWWSAGGPGQAAGYRKSTDPRYAHLDVLVTFSDGTLTEAPPIEVNGSWVGLNLTQDLFMNLKGQVLAATGAGSALWDGERWQLMPRPALEPGQTLLSDRIVALNNQGQWLLDLTIQQASGQFVSKGMLVSGNQTKLFSGKPTALSDSGHVSVEEDIQGEVQARVYHPDGNLLMGGRIAWGNSSHLPSVKALMADGTAVGTVYIPGLIDEGGLAIDQSLFRASPTQVELWLRGSPASDTRTIYHFVQTEFNRLGDVMGHLVAQPVAGTDPKSPRDPWVRFLMMGDQLFDAATLLKPGPDNPDSNAVAGFRLNDGRRMVQCQDRQWPKYDCWLIEPESSAASTQ